MRYLYSFLLTMLLCISSSMLLAQPGDPGGDPDNPVPIGGLEILLIGGAALGAKRLIKKK